MTYLLTYLAISALATVVAWTMCVVSARGDNQAEATHAAMQGQWGQVRVSA